MAFPKSTDPVRTIEGMYSGTVTRIAYAFKDHANFGQSTKAIIQECSKQYQDALDDCEIQILDAKWYLEHQLLLRKQKREAKAREEQAATAKRKHSEIEDEAEKEHDQKRVKVNDAPKEDEPDVAPPAIETPPKQKTPEKPKEKPTPEKQPSPAKPADPEPEKPPEVNDEFSIPPEPTPADPGTVATMEGADDFNQFESMFGEVTGDDGGGEPGGDIGFDLVDDVFGDSVNDSSNNVGGMEPSDLNSLLPGLESYANQDSTNATQNQESSITQAMDFGLPELGGPNEFDMMFETGDFDGTAMEGNMNDDVNVDLDPNMDFESMFSTGH